MDTLSLQIVIYPLGGGGGGRGWEVVVGGYGGFLRKKD